MQRRCFSLIGHRIFLILIALGLFTSCTSGGYSRPYITDVSHNEIASEQSEQR